MTVCHTRKPARQASIFRTRELPSCCLILACIGASFDNAHPYLTDSVVQYNKPNRAIISEAVVGEDVHIHTWPYPLNLTSS